MLSLAPKQKLDKELLGPCSTPVPKSCPLNADMVLSGQSPEKNPDEDKGRAFV